MNLKEKGFTLVELLLAMALFSFILLFATTGFIIINRAYNKGLTVKLVQDEGRKLVEELTREIRVSSAEGIDTVSKPDCISLNGYRYYWSIPMSGAANSPGRLLKEEGKNCADSIVIASPGGVDVLNTRIGVQFMAVTRVAASTSTYSVKVVLSTADTDLVDTTGENATCTTNSGNQYCDIVTLTTVVNSR